MQATENEISCVLDVIPDSESHPNPVHTSLPSQGRDREGSPLELGRNIPRNPLTSEKSVRSETDLTLALS